MTKIAVSYQGQLRTEAKHLNSGETIITDAPTDNKGKGEAFSPTDLVAAAYASCMLTIIGIYCQEHQLEFSNGHADVEKIMTSNPRRIGELIIFIDLSGNNWTEKEQVKIKNAALACPVAKTVHNELKATIEFKF